MIKEGYFACVFSQYLFVETSNKHKSEAMARFIGSYIDRTTESEIRLINLSLCKVEMKMYKSNNVNRAHINGKKANLDIPANTLVYVGKY